MFCKAFWQQKARSLGFDVGFFLRGAFWLNAEKAVRMASEVGVTVLLARFTSKAVLGQFELALSLFTMVSILAVTGFNGSLLRALAQGFDGTLREVLRLSWRWSLLGVAVLLIGGAIWYQHTSSVLGLALAISAPVFPFFAVLRRWDIVLQAKERFRERAIYYSIMSVLTLAGVIGAMKVWPGNVLPIFLTVITIQAACNIIFLRRAARWLVNTEVEAGWKMSGYKLYLSELFDVLYSRLDRLIVAGWLGVEALAVYAIATKIGEGLKLIIGGLVSVYIPRLYRHGTRSVLARLKVYRWYLLGFGAALVAAAWALTPAAIVWLFGDAYEEASGFAQVYLWILPGHLVASVWGYLLIRERRELVFLASGVGAGLINIISYVVLIPMIGIYGAVLGSVAYYAALALFYVLAVHRVVARSS